MNDIREIGPRLSQQSLLRRFLWPSWTARKRLLIREAWLVVLTCYPAVAFAYLWPVDFRDDRPAFGAVALAVFMFRTFLFHTGLLLLAAALFAACVRNRRLTLACVPLLAVMLGPSLVACLPRSPAPVQGETLTVMSVNLLMINRETAAMIDEIRAASPDVLMLQEYTEHWHAALREGLGRELPYYACEAREDSFGIAIYSKRPFVEPARIGIELGGVSVPQMRAVVAVSGAPVALYNIHLLPPRSLRLAASQRRATADLADLLKREKLPVVVSGDFNFTERTPHFGLLADIGLAETHQLAGRGRGSTWPTLLFFRYAPGLRLDRILLSSQLTAVESRTGVGTGSDHRPVIARVGLRSLPVPGPTTRDDL